MPNTVITIFSPVTRSANIPLLFAIIISFSFLFNQPSKLLQPVVWPSGNDAGHINKLLYGKPVSMGWVSSWSLISHLGKHRGDWKWVWTKEGTVTLCDCGVKASTVHSTCYPHIPIGNVWIYQLLFVCFLCVFVWLRISLPRIKLATSVHRRPRLGTTNFCELCQNQPTNRPACALNYK